MLTIVKTHSKSTTSELCGHLTERLKDGYVQWSSVATATLPAPGTAAASLPAAAALPLSAAAPPVVVTLLAIATPTSLPLPTLAATLALLFPFN